MSLKFEVFSKSAFPKHFPSIKWSILCIQFFFQGEQHGIIWPTATQSDDHLALSIAAPGQPGQLSIAVSLKKP